MEDLVRAWEQRGYSCTLWTDPPGQVWADFVHDVDELVVLAAGEIELALQGRTIRPQIGEEIYIPAHVRHTVTNSGSTTNRWYFGYKRAQ